MSIQFPASVLDPRIKNAGLLVNLLSGDDELTLNEEWFSAPFSADNIGGVGARPEQLLDLLASLLPDPATDTPDDDYAWYPVNIGGKTTGVYIIMSKDHSTDPAILGVGLWYAKEWGSDPTITTTVWAILPFFSLSDSGWQFVLGKQGHPVQTVGQVQTDQTFTVGGQTYEILQLTGNFLFDGTKPTFSLDFLLTDGTPVAAYDTVQSILDGDVEDWVNAVLSLPAVRDFLNQGIGSSDVGLGQILVDIKILDVTGSGEDAVYTVGDLSAFLDQDPIQVAEAMLFVGLDVLAGQESPLIPVGNGGIDVVTRDEGDSKTWYGVRIFLPDVGKSVGEGGEPEDAPPTEGGAGSEANQPQMVLQLGKFMTGEETPEESWLARSDADYNDEEPGIYGWFIEHDANADTSVFKLRLELVSVGLDYSGGNDNPLIDVQGVVLGGMEPRAYLAMDLTAQGAASDVQWGGGIRLDQIGLPMGGNFDEVQGDNPVASNLLASGDGDGGGAPEGETDAVNPTFSTSASYVTQLDVQLYDPDDAQTDRLWFPVQKALGPLQCRRLGVEWIQDETFLSLMFDGDVSLGELTVGMLGLSLGMNVKEPTNTSDYKLGLDGLAVSFSSSSVKISGGLLRNKDVTPLAYDGVAFVEIAEVGIGALGSYTTVDDAPSLFVFAFLDAPIGGPPAFFVKGICAGFGYNRDLKIPGESEVQDFPFVAALTDPSKIGGPNATPSEALSSLDGWVPAQRGQYWLAAGLKFTSFEIVNGNALAIVRFGQHFEIDLLGLATIKLPQVGPTYAYAVLQLRVVIDPGDGLFAASLVLAPESYVLDKDCQLTGGFAFYLWFGPNEHAGDFVVTLGGYHPAFDKPEWYPDESRLGFNWPVSKEVTISGGAYFALTPSCGMLGGSLEVQYASGDLKAWFTAHADILVFWKPFYFDATIGVSVGVSYRIKVLFVKKTVKLELGANLDLYGPPTGGKLKVSLSIVSFTVKFGADKQDRVPTVPWDEFETLLPQQPTETPSPAAKSRATFSAQGAALADNGVLELEAEEPTSEPAVLTISADSGLLSTTGTGTDLHWFVRPDEFAFSTKTAVPSTSSVLVDSTGRHARTENASGVTANTDISVRPMGIEGATAEHSVQLKNSSGALVSWDSFDADLSLGSTPEAMWGAPVETLTADAKLIDDCALGFRGIRHKPHSTLSGPPAIDVEAAFTYVIVDDLERGWLPIDPETVPPDSGGPEPSTTTLQTISQTLTQTATARTDLFDALATLGVDAGANGPLTAFAANPTAELRANPMVGSPVSSAQA